MPRLLYAGVKPDTARAMLSMCENDPFASMHAIHGKVMGNLVMGHLYWMQRIDMRIGKN